MIGATIKELRLKRGLSLTKLSEISGVSKSYLSFIERGKQKNPSIDVLEKIAQALHVPLEQIIYGERMQMNRQVDKEVLELAMELSKVDIDKEKLRQFKEFIKLLK